MAALLKDDIGPAKGARYRSTGALIYESSFESPSIWRRVAHCELLRTVIIALNSEPAYYINLVVGTRCGTDEETSRVPLLYGRSGWCCSRRAVGVGPNCPSEAALEGDQ
jgi:hypothetical protein